MDATSPVTLPSVLCLRTPGTLTFHPFLSHCVFSRAIITLNSSKKICYFLVLTCSKYPVRKATQTPAETHLLHFPKKLFLEVLGGGFCHCAATLRKENGSEQREWEFLWEFYQEERYQVQSIITNHKFASRGLTIWKKNPQQTSLVGKQYPVDRICIENKKNKLKYKRHNSCCTWLCLCNPTPINDKLG